MATLTTRTDTLLPSLSSPTYCSTVHSAETTNDYTTGKCTSTGTGTGNCNNNDTNNNDSNTSDNSRSNNVGGAGEATMFQEVAGMTKNLIGCGALSLPNGIALFTNSSSYSVVLVSCTWIVLMGYIFGYYCWFLGGKICVETNTYTYRSAWKVSVGNTGSIPVAVSNTIKAALALLAYASIVTDTVIALHKSYVGGIGGGMIQQRQKQEQIDSNLIGTEMYNTSLSDSIDTLHLDEQRNNAFIQRTLCLLLVTITMFVPLCFLKNVKVLAPFSIIGTGGIIFTTIAMFVRYVDGTYTSPNGLYYQDLVHTIHEPMFGTINHTWTFDVLPFVCMVYESFVMHYNAPRFYRELKDRSLHRYGIACSASFGLSAVLYAGIACFGYLTFGGNSSSFILNNYSPYDPVATICRVAVGLSTVTAYPIVFMAVRDGILDVLDIPIEQQTNYRLNIITVVLISILTAISIFVHDLGLINAVGGGLIATSIVFVFPTIMYISIVRTKQLQLQQQVLNSTSIGSTYSETDALLIESSCVVDKRKDTPIHPNHAQHQHQQQQQITVMMEVSVTIALSIVGVIIGLVGAYTAVQLAKK